MKILYVVNVDWYFCLHWLDRAEAMRDKGYDVHVLTTITSSEHLLDMESRGFTVHQMRLRRISINIFYEFYTLMTIFRYYLKLNPDLTHLITIKPVIYGGIVSKILNVKAIASLVGFGLVNSNDDNLRLKRLIKFLLRLSLPSDIVLENSDDRSHIEKLKPNSKPIVIDGAGVDITKFSYTKRTTGGAIKVLFASRLLWSKGLGCLVEACQRLKVEDIHIELHVAGIQDTDAKNAIPDEIINQWAGDGDIIWHGNVQDMPGLISQVDIVCLPTTYGEGVPRILIESAACGRPIVAPSVPGCSDIVQHNVTGLLYCPLEDDGLYLSLLEMVKLRDSYHQFGREARQLVKHRFSNEVVIGQWMEFYKERLVDVGAYR
ncbi:glycosyltransferase family 4 protein [Amphritea sp. HPY]|uniref:glycosyltransferase family 4 protein n=1 Tax=Amphritea sp. HPY TaxID=3421652 RepID=UPI003D7C7A99